MTTSSVARSAVNGIRIALGVGGAVAVIVGIVILVWPGRAAEVVTAMIAIYAIVAGLIYAALGIFSRSMHAWPRIGHILLGALFVIAGIVAFLNLTATTVWLALFLGILVGVMWIVEGVVALTTLHDTGSRAWSIFFAILSIIAGVILLFSPLMGAVVLFWLLGISLIVLGVFQVIRAFTFGRAL
jgi:uncharacterized membrane protein HdeD (DUF308 family)